MFSKTCEYAIRAMIFISQKSNDGSKVSIREIAEGAASPEQFTAKIMQNLSRKGFVQSSKGPTGGFYLDKEALTHTLADIVQTVDGDKIFSGCGLGLKNCSEEEPCPLHQHFKKIREETFDMLKNARLSDFTQPDKKPLFLKR